MLLASGCPDPEARFNEFIDGSKDHRMDAGEGEGEGDGDGDGDTGIEGVPDMSGAYLFALETSLGPELPLQFVTTIDMTVNEDGSGAVADLSFQPLSLDQGEVLTPREFVGDPLVFPGVEFDMDGNYELDMGIVMVDGAANPITGSDITASLVVLGRIVHADALCGELTGMLMSPLESDLAGSTFAALRLADDGSDPSTLPLMFPYRCNMVPDMEEPEFSGTFLWALETSLGPDLPLQFATTVTYTASADGLSDTADFSFQPLSLDQGEILSPREFIGDPLEFPGVPVDADGKYMIDMGVVSVEGGANPITGSDITASLVIDGEIRNFNSMCGTLSGMLMSPLESDLAGSTFAAKRLADDGSDPGTLPTEFPYKCSQL
ncbi:hypothetical protein DB30_01968 [Enhygromyxa salina]|uniref:Uncharacterized protein n=2 Tax=Enhygromyxa salina TaxID=215803 RepID=A0A0C2D4F4_9BACT|nr:hypothetical protein DB30_01968 [Enhygromyxa salina]